MTKLANEKLRPTEDDLTTRMQVVSLLIVLGLLLLTSYGNAGLMYMCSLGAVFALAIWFVVDRRMWLAFLSSVTFAVGVLFFAKSLF